MGKIINNKGITMPLVLIVMLFATIIGFSSLYMVNTQELFNTIDNTTKKTLEYAEAGYYKYLWHLNDDVNFYLTDAGIEMNGKTFEYLDGYYKLEISPPKADDRFITIKSTGWVKSNPDKKTTVEAKIRKKQFVHHVYVSSADEYYDKNKNLVKVWWSENDECHGPYHTNLNLYVEYTPTFYDTVTYTGKYFGKTSSNGEKELKTDDEKKATNKYYNPNFLVKNPQQPQKVDILEFPESNIELKKWAEKDGMIFTGRTCIFLNGKNMKIRKNDGSTQNIDIRSIKNRVVYIDGNTSNTANKFDLGLGNLFISGELDEKLTIAAANEIYITYDDPTNWYDYIASDLTKQGATPPHPPKSPPLNGGIKYRDITFKELKVGNSYERKTEGKGKAMLGLVANNNIMILHYGWPKMPMSSDGGKSYWDFEWEWGDYGIYEKERLNAGIYYDITIKGKGKYSILKVGNGKNDNLIPGDYYVWKPDLSWGKKDYTYDMAPKDITIHAALFSIKQGFGFEGYNEGVGKGKITLWGNITQSIRKPVKQGIPGYDKNYFHDPRMFYDYPPHILEPTNVGWEVHDWKEIN